MITRDEIRKRITAALVWKRNEERHRPPTGIASVLLDKPLPPPVERIAIEHSADLFGLQLEVTDCDWREGADGYTYGTGKDPCPEGAADSTDFAQADAIDAAVEHFVEVLKFFGVPVVHRWLTIEHPGPTPIRVMQSIRSVLGVGLREAHQCTRGMSALTAQEGEHAALIARLAPLGVAYTFHTEDPT